MNVTTIKRGIGVLILITTHVIMAHIAVAQPLQQGEQQQGEQSESQQEQGSQTAEVSPMNNARLDELIRHLDENTNGVPGNWSFVIEGVNVQVITDERADRMRILAPILKTDGLTKEQLFRMLQANFDTTLDARYAIANNILWSTFIHPLGSLSDEAFLVGVGQTVNAVVTYGSSYSSGLLNFRGGDSEAILRRDLIERLKKRGSEI